MATLGPANKLITKELTWHANMTDQNALGKNLHIKPYKFEGVMNKLFSAQNYYSSNPLTSMLMGTKAEKSITQTEWEWELKGATTRPLIVVENVEPASNVTPGRYRKTFKIKLDENWYLPGDEIHPGASNKKYYVRVQNQGVKQGDGTVYTVMLVTDNPKDFLPVKYLQPGQQWTKGFSRYEEAAEQSGSTVFSSTLAFRNRMSKYRKEYRITDYASQEVLAVKVPDSKGTLHNMWMRMVEVEFWEQWYRELELGAWYSRSSDSVPGANGRPVRMGPGIQEQLEDSHIYRYSTLTAKLIEEYLMDIFYSRVKPGKGRQVVGYTGEYGMLQFHKAIESKVNASGFIKNVEVFAKQTSNPLHTNSLEYGYQYTKYNMANGASLTLVHNPAYDDRNMHFEIDELTGFPVESQRITFLDFSGDSGANVQLMNKEGSYSFGYVEGMFGPNGGKNGGMMAHAGDYYEMHVNKSCGVHIEDVSKCGELLLARA